MVSTRCFKILDHIKVIDQIGIDFLKREGYMFGFILPYVEIQFDSNICKEAEHPQKYIYK